MYNLPDTAIFIMGAFVLVVLCIFLWRVYLLISKKSKKNKSKERLYKKMNNLPTNYLEDESYRQSLRILDEARLKSLKIVADSKVFDEEAKLDIRDKLEKIFQAQVSSLQEVSQQMLSKYTDIISAEIETFKETLHEGTISTTKKVDAQVHEEYNRVKKEIDEYKATRIKEIDDAIYNILFIYSP